MEAFRPLYGRPLRCLLEEIRIAAGLTLADMARRFNIEYSTLWKMEAGESGSDNGLAAYGELLRQRR